MVFRRSFPATADASAVAAVHASQPSRASVAVTGVPPAVLPVSTSGPDRAGHPRTSGAAGAASVDGLVGDGAPFLRSRTPGAGGDSTGSRGSRGSGEGTRPGPNGSFGNNSGADRGFTADRAHPDPNGATRHLWPFA